MNIKDYLKYYIGCDVIVDGGNKAKFLGGWLVPNSIDQIYYNLHDYESMKDEGPDFCMPYNDDLSEDCRIKPILRRIESITDAECAANAWTDRKGFFRFIEAHRYDHHIRWFPGDFHYLLSLGIDLFGLIDAGLAIDAATINQQTEGK